MCLSCMKLSFVRSQKSLNIFARIVCTSNDITWYVFVRLRLHDKVSTWEEKCYELTRQKNIYVRTRPPYNIICVGEKKGGRKTFVVVAKMRKLVCEYRFFCQYEFFSHSKKKRVLLPYARAHIFLWQYKKIRYIMWHTKWWSNIQRQIVLCVALAKIKLKAYVQVLLLLLIKYAFFFTLSLSWTAKKVRFLSTKLFSLRKLLTWPLIVNWKSSSAEKNQYQISYFTRHRFTSSLSSALEIIYVESFMIEKMRNGD